ERLQRRVDDGRVRVQVQACVHGGGGAGLHAGGGNLDRRAAGADQARARIIFQVTLVVQGQLAIARVDRFQAVLEGEEAFTTDGQVQAVAGGGQAAGGEVLHHAGDLGSQADAGGAGIDVGKARGRAFEAHGLRV